MVTHLSLKDAYKLYSIWSGKEPASHEIFTNVTETMEH